MHVELKAVAQSPVSPCICAIKLSLPMPPVKASAQSVYGAVHIE